MPFARKYRFTMGIPDVGGRIDEFEVLASEVGHVERGDGTIDYPVTLILAGPGGAQTARKAVRRSFRGRTTFSGFGTPYQLSLGDVRVESLGGRRYRVSAHGVGVRIDLEREIRRFLAYARLRRRTASTSLVEPYLEDYRRDVTRRSPLLEY